MRRFAVIVVVIAAGTCLGGCGLVHKVSAQRVSLADRCADVMKAAMPFAAIDIDKRTSENAGIDTIVARVAGTRTDLPKDMPAARELAVECNFYDNILTGFHWTKGGPPD